MDTGAILATAKVVMNLEFLDTIEELSISKYAELLRKL
jgi:hypothetical protein